jgi:hypothetical protein
MKTKETAVDEVSTRWRRLVGRRSFLKGVGAVSATLPAGVLLATRVQAAATLREGDIAILRFLAAAEIIESDLWEQYTELGGAPLDDGSTTGRNTAYVKALSNIDGDMPQYITDNTEDEFTHADFINAYLKAHGAPTVNLEKFRTLNGSTATGATKKKRLTNLKQLDVDTSWYTRYRSNENPDFGFSPAQLLKITGRPAIPRTDADTVDPNRIQAIADTAAFHFAFIEQGGSSLYTTMALKASSLEVLRIVISIGGVEVDHFSLWHDKVANAVGSAHATDNGPGLPAVSFLDLSGSTDPLVQTNKILPEPCDFISESLPEVSVIRPSTVKNSGAMAAVKAFRDDKLFVGQSQEFLDTITKLARAADDAEREV